MDVVGGGFEDGGWGWGCGDGVFMGWKLDDFVWI